MKERMNCRSLPMDGAPKTPEVPPAHLQTDGRWWSASDRTAAVTSGKQSGRGPLKELRFGVRCQKNK